MAASLRAATDTEISAGAPPMAGVSGDIQGAPQTPQSQQITQLQQTPESQQTAQAPQISQSSQASQPPLPASLLALSKADSASITASSPATRPIASGPVAAPKSDTGAPEPPAKGSSPQKSLKPAEGVVQSPALASEVAAAANFAPTSEQTTTWKGIVNAVVATTMLPAPLCAGDTKETPTLANLPLATQTPQEQKVPAIAHSDAQSSRPNHNEQQFSETFNSANATPVAAPTHDIPQFSALLSSPSPTKDDAAQTSSGPSAAIPIPPPASDRLTAATIAPAVDTPSASSHASLAAYQPDSASGKFVSSAQLLAGAGHSEMRVSLDTEKLGSIELRARLTGDQVGAAIVVEKREAHAALAIELPALQQALSDKQLRVDQVSLLHGTFSATTGDAGASAKQDQPHAPRGPQGSSLGGSNLSAQLSVSGAQSGIFDSQGHLSVHA
jgi:hypothetical protein